VQFEITFQAIQNYIPDDNGNKMANTIDNSLKIFQEFINDKLKPTDLKYFDITIANGRVTISLKDGVEYPDTIILPSIDAAGNQITHIDTSFASNANIKNIIVPAGYTSMDEGAFKGNTTIESIDLSRTSMTEIPRYCFQNSTIKTIELPNTMEVIIGSAFKGSTLSSISFPESLTEIGGDAFANTNLKSIYIPENLTTIRDAFNSPYLTTIEVDENNKTFYDVDDRCLINYNGGFQSYAKANPATTFTVPEGVTTIMNFAFYNAKNLVTVNLPTTLKSMDDQPFDYCSSLVNLNVNSIITYDYGFAQGSKIVEYELTNPVTKQLIMYMNYLKKLTIDSTCMSLANRAISNCSVLEILIFESETPPTFASNTFWTEMPSNYKIYVPDSAVSAYKAVANLSSYASHIYGISEYK